MRKTPTRPQTQEATPLKQQQRRITIHDVIAPAAGSVALDLRYRKPTPTTSDRIKTIAHRAHRPLRAITKILFYPLMGVVLIAFSSNHRVYATATPNDDYRTVTQVYVTSSDLVTSCHTDTNVTGSWSSYINDASKWLYTTDQAAYASSFATALASGSWAVNQHGDTDSRRLVDIYWYDNASGGQASVDWTSGAVVYNPPSGGTLHFVRLGVDGACAVKVVNSQTYNTGRILSIDPDVSSEDTKNLLVGGLVTINYPSGYVGIPIVTTAHLANVVYPVINYTVDNYELDASYGYNLNYHAPQSVQLNWNLYQKQTGGALTSVGDTITTAENEHAKIKISTIGDYVLVLEYHIIPPATYDINNVDTIGTTSVGFNYDGTAITQSTQDMTCTNGNCVPLAIYADCSTYGVNVVGGFGCVVGNALKAIQAFLKYLFIPNALKLKDSFDAMSTKADEKLGFLLYPVTFVVQFFTAFGDTSNNWCTESSCTKSFGNLFGKDYTVNFTQLKTTIPSMYDFMITAIRALTIFGVLYMLRRKYLEVMTS